MPKPKRAKKSVAHNDPHAHEGARESSKPGEPQSRQVITPDWPSLEKEMEEGDVMPKTAPPKIDRHR